MAIVVKCGDEEMKLNECNTAPSILRHVVDRFGPRKKTQLLKQEDGSLVFDTDKGMLSAGIYLYEPALPAAERDATFGKLATPSQQDYNVVKDDQCGETPELFNFRPASAAPPLPLQLVSPAFGEFLDSLESNSCTDEDYDQYAMLAVATSAFYDSEHDLVLKLRQLWHKYCGLNVWEEMHTGKRLGGPAGKTFTAMGIPDYLTQALLALFEVKRGVSVAPTEPVPQAANNYKLYYCKARPGIKCALSGMCFPALVLEHVGQELRVGALATLRGHVCYQPLTIIDLVHIHAHDQRMAVRGALVCAAVKRTILSLQAMYRSYAEDAEQVVDPFQLLIEQECIPYPLADSLALGMTVKQLCEPRRVYLKRVTKTGEASVYKYAQSYGFAVHRAWGDAGYAPRCLNWAKLPGGWWEVEMEYLDPDQGWELLYGHKDAEEIRPKVVGCLRQAHQVRVGKTTDGKLDTYGVHGDMRDNNVMVRLCENERVEVRFIDFDWAKEEGMPDAVYPPFMSQEINWAKGVGAHRLMLQAHDLSLLGSSQEQQIKRSQLVSRRRPVVKRKERD